MKNKYNSISIKKDQSPSFKFKVLIIWTATVLSLFHIFFLLGIKPHKQREVSIAESIATEYESADKYQHWEKRDCPRTLTTTLRYLASDFELEMRHSSTTSAQEEYEMSRPIRKQAASIFEGKISKDHKTEAYLNDLVQSFRPFLTRPAMEYRVHLVENEELNAFAIPGGDIYMFTGILEKAIENEAQLMMVLAHEVAHIDQGHMLAFTNVLDKLVLSNAEPVQNALLFLINQPFSLVREEEADALALGWVAQLGYSPFQGVAIIEKISTDSKSLARQKPIKQDSESNITSLLNTSLNVIDELIQTHPEPIRRLCLARNRCLDLHLQYTNALYYGKSNFLFKIPKTDTIF